MKRLIFARLFILYAVLFSAQSRADDNGIAESINWPGFLLQHEMILDRVPSRWELAPYTGNGNVGFLFCQGEDDAENVISIHTGRHEYYDHRLPHEGNENLWIYRGRLPLGRFKLQSKGNIKSADLRLSLWDAELTGTIRTDQGSYAVRGFSHSLNDVIYFETDASDGESVQITWHSDVHSFVSSENAGLRWRPQRWHLGQHANGSHAHATSTDPERRRWDTVLFPAPA